MTVEELREWLEEHIDSIVCFMDYEPSLESEEELAETLGYWFDNDTWKEAGHRFIHLGIDGTGSQLAAWLRPGVEGPPPVVFFGSEGGRGVLVDSPEKWALVLGHAPSIDDVEEPATLSKDNWMLSEDENDPEEVAEIKEHLQEYRMAIRDHFEIERLPALKKLTRGLTTLNREFIAWIDDQVE